MVCGVDVACRKLSSPVWHGKNTTDGSRIVAVDWVSKSLSIPWWSIPEEDTSEGNENTDDDGRPGRASYALRLLDHYTHGRRCITERIIGVVGL
jgi:hypothetical protein